MGRRKNAAGISVFGCLLLLLPLLTIKSFGCTLVVIPATKFDPAEFIFTGEVVGFSGPLTNKHVLGEVWGVVIKPEREIYLPSESIEYFEVYPYQVTDDCKNIGWLKSALAHHYPVGSKVRVIAVVAKNLEGGMANGNLRLAVPVGNDGGVLVIERGSSAISVKSTYDYKAHRKSGASKADLTLEVRKDLLKLWRAKGEGEKVAILERLIYHPYKIDYEKILENHIADKVVAASLLRRRKEWERSQAAGIEK